MEQNETIDNVNLKAKRPTFITVLCILTFIISGFVIFNGITATLMSGITPQNTQAMKQLDSLSNAMVSDSTTTPEERAGKEMVGKMLDSTLVGLTPENIRNAGIAGLVSGVLTLLGALMMWGLRKAGFWVYVLGVLVSIIAPVAIYGTGNWIGLASSIGMGFVGIIFIILYAVNRKHLVN